MPQDNYGNCYFTINAGVGHLDPNNPQGFWLSGLSPADSHLIAAAPDLLAALRRMLAHSCVADAGADMKRAEDHEAEREAYAAIAKAEGH